MSDFEQHLRELMRELDDDDAVRHEPPASIWSAIESAVAPLPTSDPMADDQPGADTTVDAASVTPVSENTAPVIELESRRRRSTQWLLTAAAAVVAIVGVSVVVGQLRNENDVLAAIDITSEGLDGAPAGLDTEAIIEQVDGHRQLRVGSADIAIGDDEFFELWLINGDVTDMVSLGTLSSFAGQHTYIIPDDVDLDRFPIVDVSVELNDGDPTHSGHSVLRGRLDA